MKPHQLVKMSEEALQKEILQAAKLHRWRRVHFKVGRVAEDKNGRPIWVTPFEGDPGFPDLVLVKRPRVLYRELKQDGKNPTPEQQAWLDDFVACGQDAKVWRPTDWISGEILKELTR